MLFTIIGMAGYKIAPIWIGQHAINTFLKQQGVPSGRIPAACRRDLAQDAFNSAEIQTIGKGTAAKAAQYTESLEVRAFQVVALFTTTNRRDPALQTAQRTRAILEAHGITPPP